MPFSIGWIITVVGFVLALFVWAKTKRIGPALAVFLGAIVIVALADESMLTSLGTKAREIINDAIGRATQG